LIKSVNVGLSVNEFEDSMAEELIEQVRKPNLPGY
jgi:hypothetical protein